jgi:Cu/Zn superoxide dismutase
MDATLQRPQPPLLRGVALLAVTAAVVLSATIALPARAAPAVVTSGDVHAFATSNDPGITGHAQMVRTADGKTLVMVHVAGLLPGTTYGAHVHQQSCGNGNADGHYRFDPAGAAAPPNEIWPGFTTDADGVGNGRAVAYGTAGPTAVSVVIHAPGGAKIACADLS